MTGENNGVTFFNMESVTITLHPDFIEDLKSLTADARIRLYSIMLNQYNSLRDELDRFYPVSGARSYSYSTVFHHVTHAPPVIAAFDNRAKTGAIIYLSVAPFTTDDELTGKAAERLDGLRHGEADAIDFNAYLNECDHTEKMAALDHNGRKAQRGFHLHVLKKALGEGHEDAAHLFNVSAPQMDRMIKRFDFLLERMDRRLNNHHGQIRLSISFTGSENFEAASLQELLTLE